MLSNRRRDFMTEKHKICHSKWETKSYSDVRTYDNLDLAQSWRTATLDLSESKKCGECMDKPTN